MYGKNKRSKGIRLKFADKISKQETTALKIELAGEAIRKENLRRKKHNNNIWRINRGADGFPMLRPSGMNTELHGRPGRTISNKYLCGMLSRLCNVMRKAGIAYPWTESEAR